MLRKSDDSHLILTEALQFIHINGHKPALVASRFCQFRSSTPFIRHILVTLRMACMIPDLWMGVLRNRYAIAREFWNIPLLVSAIFLFPLRHRIIFNINHNLKLLPEKFPSSIMVLAWLGFRFMLMDGENAALLLPERVCRAFLLPLFPSRPLHERATAKDFSFHTRKPVVGVVGDLRKEKGDRDEILSVLRTLASNEQISVHLGLRNGTLSDAAALGNVTQANTSSREHYFEFLKNTDVIIIFADHRRYFCRHSGTVMDAIACGAVPMVPALPVLLSQVSNPQPVGVVFDTNLDIASTLQKALTLVPDAYLARRQYFEARHFINVSIP